VIRANPLNWRVHPKLQRLTLEDSLGTIGWIQKPIVNRTSGNLIDGHLRVAAAAARGEAEIPVSYVELTEDEERAALASLDPMAGMAVMDGEKLAELLVELEIGSGELNALFDDLRDQAEGAHLASAEKSGTGLLTKGKPVVKAVIAVVDMNTIERALAKSGVASRGDALLTICRAYLDEKRQFDVEPQNSVAPVAAQKTPGTDRDGDARRARPGVEKGVQRTRPGRRVRGKNGKG
jgi:hypothetical protein